MVIFVISCNLIPQNTQKAEWEGGGGKHPFTPPEINPAYHIALTTLDTRESIILSAVDLYMY